MTCGRCGREMAAQEIQTRDGLCLWCDYHSRDRSDLADIPMRRWVAEADADLERIFPGSKKEE